MSQQQAARGHADDPESMSVNERTVRTVVEILGDGSRIDELDDYLTEDYVRHGHSRDMGREEFKEVIRELHRGIPAMTTSEIELIEQGSTVAYRWQSTGVHAGQYMGVIATGKCVRAKGITMSRLRDGRICEEWASWNEVSLLHELGIIPLGQ
ncbi:hypothetical protein JCM18899A_31530 [Nocardioides sp. AN3]